jgi:hypothetical protein
MTWYRSVTLPLIHLYTIAMQRYPNSAFRKIIYF